MSSYLINMLMLDLHTSGHGIRSIPWKHMIKRRTRNMKNKMVKTLAIVMTVATVSMMGTVGI